MNSARTNALLFMFPICMASHWSPPEMRPTSTKPFTGRSVLLPVFWDVDVFRGLKSNTRVIDAPKLFGMHLALSGLLCLGFGGFHLGSYPGFFVSDAFGLYRCGHPQNPWLYESVFGTN